MKRFRKGILILLALVMTINLVSVGASAANQSERLIDGWYNLYLLLYAYGEYDWTNDREKKINQDFADVEEITITPDSATSVWLRVRSSANDAAVTEAGQIFQYDSWWRPGYKEVNGESLGIVGNEYYIKGQTPSASAYDASVTAIWAP